MDFDKFSYSYTCIFIFLAFMLLLGSRKDMELFIRMNFLGIFFTLFIIVFIVWFGVIGIRSPSDYILLTVENQYQQN